MSSPPRRRPVRLRRALRLTALALILCGPLVTGSLALRFPDTRTREGEITAANASDPRAAWVRDYLDVRRPDIDRLLPDGAGGTHFFRDLDGSAGMAFTDTAAIGLAANLDLNGWPEATELHERAHLVDAFLPADVAALMAALPAPATDELATDPGQHFAEMAARAWEIVAEPVGVCVAGTPLQRLEDAEQRVPGTSGFVVWYLQQMKTTAGDDVAARAAELSSAQRGQWAPIWRALEARRHPDGRFAPWRDASVYDHLQRRRGQLAASPQLLDRLASHLLVPSLTLARITSASTR